MHPCPTQHCSVRLQWVRLAGQLDLLDAPGVIPTAFQDQVTPETGVSLFKPYYTLAWGAGALKTINS